MTEKVTTYLLAVAWWVILNSPDLFIFLFKFLYENFKLLFATEQL